MKIYCVSRDGDPDGHKGYSFHSNHLEAMKEKRKWDGEENSPGFATEDSHCASITIIELAATKRGILRALNIYAGHNNNG